MIQAPRRWERTRPLLGTRSVEGRSGASTSCPRPAHRGGGGEGLDADRPRDPLGDLCRGGRGRAARGESHGGLPAVAPAGNSREERAQNIRAMTREEPARFLRAGTTTTSTTTVTVPTTSTT